MTRNELINALIHYELEWFIDHPEYLNDVSEFFYNGGFHKLSDESLQKKYQLTFAEVTE